MVLSRCVTLTHSLSINYLVFTFDKMFSPKPVYYYYYDDDDDHHIIIIIWIMCQIIQVDTRWAHSHDLSVRISLCLATDVYHKSFKSWPCNIWRVFHLSFQPDTFGCCFTHLFCHLQNEAVKEQWHNNNNS